MTDDDIHKMMDRAHYAEIREARLRIEIDRLVTENTALTCERDLWKDSARQFKADSDRLTAENRRVVAEIKVADTERDLARSRAQGWFDSLKSESARADRLAAALREIKPLTASLSFDLWQKCERIIDAALAGTAEPDSSPYCKDCVWPRECLHRGCKRVRLGTAVVKTAAP